MPSSHLPRTPCDKFVYDFLRDFLGIVGGYGICVHIVYGHRAFSSTGPREQPGVNPYRDCAEIVRKSCNVSAVAVQSRPSHGACAGIVQCHLHVYGLRSYDFSKFVKLLAKPNRRGRGARESIQKSHSHLLPPQGGLAEAARKGGYGQDTGSVDPSQAKCELGISSELQLSTIFSIESQKDVSLFVTLLHKTNKTVVQPSFVIWQKNKWFG